MAGVYVRVCGGEDAGCECENAIEGTRMLAVEEARSDAETAVPGVGILLAGGVGWRRGFAWKHSLDAVDSGQRIGGRDKVARQPGYSIGRPASPAPSACCLPAYSAALRASAATTAYPRTHQRKVTYIGEDRNTYPGTSP
ncbi:hypothetical protein ANO11243_029740 [Dothideomycetidae sp. 11243]|nr:hypothetical protein ANO11243_029740 [fungal sp. No.11243]